MEDNIGCLVCETSCFISSFLDKHEITHTDKRNKCFAIGMNNVMEANEFLVKHPWFYFVLDNRRRGRGFVCDTRKRYSEKFKADWNCDQNIYMEEFCLSANW